MARYHVGVDVAKRRHKACIRDLSSDSYSGVFSVEVNREGFEKFVRTLEKRSPNKEDFVIGVEATGDYGSTLAYFLLGQGYTVVEINPYRANQFRKAEGKKAKSDRIDARSLATMLSMGNHKVLVMPDPVIDNLRELTRFRVDLVHDRSALVNRLHETLVSLFPEYDAMFADLNAPTCLALLSSYPGPQYICAAGEEAVAEVLFKASHGNKGIPLAQALLQAAEKSVGIMQRQPALATKVTILGERITALNADIERVEREIEEFSKELPCDPKDFPVGGTSSVATIVAEIGDINRFPSLKTFLSHFGWCPRSFQTGSYRMEHPKMSHAGNKYVRRLIWMLSIASIANVPRYRTYFKRRVAEGKPKMDVIVAVGRKLLSAFYAILKTGVPYDPNWQNGAASATT